MNDDNMRGEAVEMDAEDLDLFWHAHLFDVGRDIRYHDKRVRFFAQVERFMLILVLVFILGCGAEVLWHGVSRELMWTFNVAAVGVFLFSVALGRWSTRHRALSAQLHELEREAMEMCVSQDALVRLSTARQRSDAGQVKRLVVLSAECHNEQCHSLGLPPERQIALSPWQRRLAPLMDIQAQRLLSQVCPRHAPRA